MSLILQGERRVQEQDESFAGSCSYSLLCFNIFKATGCTVQAGKGRYHWLSLLFPCLWIEAGWLNATAASANVNFNLSASSSSSSSSSSLSMFPSVSFPLLSPSFFSSSSSIVPSISFTLLSVSPLSLPLSLLGLSFLQFHFLFSLFLLFLFLSLSLIYLPSIPFPLQIGRASCRERVLYTV